MKAAKTFSISFEAAETVLGLMKAAAKTGSGSLETATAAVEAVSPSHLLTTKGDMFLT
jgi:hypothetical protein